MVNFTDYSKAYDAPSELLDKINLAKEKRRNLVSLTEDDIKAIEILAFYESLFLYHEPETHGDIFDKSLLSHHIESISQIAACEKIGQQGGLKEVYSKPYILTREEIGTYVNYLKNTLNLEGLNKIRAGILLSSDSHSVGLIYDTQTDSWRFMNINVWPTIEYKADNLSGLIDKIMEGFDTSNDRYTAFNASIIIPANIQVDQAIFTKLDPFPITQEMAQRKAKNGIILTYLAADKGNAQAIETLVIQGADLDNPSSDDGATPTFIPLIYSHI